jgi:ERCC4-type nuclease
MRSGVSAIGSKYKRRAASAGILKEYKLKPFQFPEDMIVVVDTREQQPIFGSRPPKGLTITVSKLDYGDYSLRGFENQFCIERKKISDLLSYCTVEREKKTKPKMEQFKRMDWVGLIIEARESEVYSPYEHSNISPEAVRQAIVSFEVRYGVHVYIGNRENSLRWMVDRMVKYYKIMKEL